MDPEHRSSNGSASRRDVVDDGFLVLRNQSRRFACYFLLEHETAAVSELADVVAGWIYTTDGRIVESQCREQCYLSLLHTHVPMLVETGVVCYDERAGTVSLAPCPEPIRTLITRACAMETSS
ncbi:hypothetical protein DV706_19425 (plasmid) [Natronorubrum bangense]|uniref:DUF7344 domain-containing protein n=3 Tax=Natronorubrum bangense TaxID=61858 RepID=A0A4D6HHU8_9EURY|nr:hypothetical protein C494_19632 [Natronorubrum bangense JCM 10635]QCC53330.1 hypothetical protein DV706_01835 [Natronorubrum bangense]QCC56660.1 hypothetical protein DV706_19425 [Natronorubrum bangense]